MADQLTFLQVPSKEEYHPTVKELPESERPTYRLHHYGPGAVSNSELIAILIGTPHQLRDASSLYTSHGSLASLAKAAPTELQQVPGIGPAAVARIKAAFELGRRLATESPTDYPQIRSPADAALLLMGDMTLLEQEHLVVLLLDTKNRVRNKVTVYKGSLNTNMIRVAEVFREAIRTNSASIIVAHNHPSGDPTPSPEDVHVTKSIVQAGKLLDIELLDHIIIGQNRFVSLKERGLGFS